jgi:hypothetical protein
MLEAAAGLIFVVLVALPALGFYVGWKMGRESR